MSYGEAGSRNRTARKSRAWSFIRGHPCMVVLNVKGGREIFTLKTISRVRYDNNKAWQTKMQARDWIKIVVKNQQLKEEKLYFEENGNGGLFLACMAAAAVTASRKHRAVRRLRGRWVQSSQNLRWRRLAASLADINRRRMNRRITS